MPIPRKEPNSHSREKKNRRKKIYIRILMSIFIGLIIAVTIRKFILFPHTMTNNFMAPNFVAGKTVYITPIFNRSYLLIGDMVLIKHPLNDTIFISRIAGKTGDRIAIINKIFYRNGNEIANSPGKYLFSDSRTPFPADFSSRDNLPEIIVKENSFFVLADNRDEGLDSREIGLISTKNLIGKALF